MADRAQKQPSVVTAAANEFMRVLMADAEFRASIAQAEITRRIESGELLEANRLSLGALKLVPAGLVDELLDLIDELAPLVPKTKLTGELKARLEDVNAANRPTAPPAAPEPEESAEPVAEEKKPPSRRRLPDEPGQCSECGVDVDLEQTRHSMIRARRVLCRPCLAEA